MTHTVLCSLHDRLFVWQSSPHSFPTEVDGPLLLVLLLRTEVQGEEGGVLLLLLLYEPSVLDVCLGGML